MTLPLIPSYTQGRWHTPDAPSSATIVVRDATTGEGTARVAASGIDVPSTLIYARTVGHESLAPLTFHQRAVLLKQFALALTARKAELYELSLAAGATRSDAWIDIDGGIGVLFAYSGKGRREMPNGTVYIDGGVEPLSKDGTFLGRHICTTLPGVAVQINAFNFPVWGSLEKFAPAFLAGMPTVVKPATPTAAIAEHMVRILVESQLLPEGSLQLIVGAGRDLLDHLRLGDTVGFTGSATTAENLRAHHTVQKGGVRFTAETDSINASILAPDATEDTPEFDAYVRQLVTEMTAKSGQKCTAIRRAIVPATLAEAVAAHVQKRLDEKVVIGDPRAEDVTMGPLVSIEQRNDVRASIQTLIDDGAVVAAGTLEEPQIVHADGSTGPAPHGAFVAPVLLRATDNSSPVVHTTEAFGPVATLLTYNTLAEAADLANLGGGSLVASIASYDPAHVTALLARIAPFHGRVLIVDRTTSRTSTGHGSPLPGLVHGGPGRAGGGEELGGIRAVLHHMQRTALQGSPDMLTAASGVWHPGASVQTTDEHPFRRPLSRLRIGDRIASALRDVTLDDIETFAHFTGDTFYAHMDEEAAAANPFFPGRVAHGYLLIAWAAGLFVDPDPGPVLANYGLENLRFTTPVSPGDRIRVTLTTKQITPRETDDYGEVRWDAVIHNQNDEVVASYDVLTLVAKD